MRAFNPAAAPFLFCLCFFSFRLPLGIEGKTPELGLVGVPNPEEECMYDLASHLCMFSQNTVVQFLQRK